LDAVHARVERWFDAFMASPGFARLNESQQRKAGPIVNHFTEYSFQHLGITPAEWDRGAVRECCTEVLPRKISAEHSFFEAIPPVLGAFFRFLAAQSLHPDGEALAETVEEIASEMTRNARDSRNWGPAKQLVMAAVEAGVDVTDNAAMQSFILQFNQRIAANFPPPDASRAMRPVSANPYDPCPCGSGKKFKFCCRPTF